MSGISLVFLSNGTCLPKQDFEAQCETLQGSRILHLLARIAWNPRERHLLSLQDAEHLALLKAKGILDLTGQLSFTVAEILKDCYDFQARTWRSCHLQIAQSAPVPRPEPRKRNPLPILKPVEEPKENSQPPPKEVEKLLWKIKGNNPVLQDLIANGGLSWTTESEYPKSVSRVKERLCKTALQSRDSALLEALIPHYSQDEIVSCVEQEIWHVFEEPGILLLKAHPRSREIVLRESLPGSRFLFHSSPAIQELLSPEEAEIVAKRKFPVELLQQLFLWRMNIPEYQNWCFKILSSASRQHLNGEVVFEELLKCPPSRHRSEMALRLTVCLNYLHSSLKENAFRFEEPADTPNLVYHAHNLVHDFLNRARIRKDFETVKLIGRNFLFLLCNKTGIAMFNTFLR